jgi:hypothetical protein
MGFLSEIRDERDVEKLMIEVISKLRGYELVEETKMTESAIGHQTIKKYYIQPKVKTNE